MLKHRVTEVMTRAGREMNTHGHQDDNSTGCSTMLPVQWHTLHNILFIKYRFTSHLWVVNSINQGGLYLTVTADANNNQKRSNKNCQWKNESNLTQKEQVCHNASWDFHCGQSVLSIPKQAVLLALWLLSCHPMSNREEEGAGTETVTSGLINASYPVLGSHNFKCKL